MAGSETALPKTITATVLDRLREEIRSGILVPGTALRQAHIAAEYGVSTTPVREAFAALEREGLIQSSAHRGVVVFRPSARDLREIYEIRIPMEALATELAVPDLTEADLKHLASLLEGMAKANRRADFERAGELNSEFHLTIYEAADRLRLLKLIAELRNSSRVYIGLFPDLASRMDETEHEHNAIYEACAARNRKKAAQAMTRHLKSTVEIVSRGLESLDTAPA